MPNRRDIIKEINKYKSEGQDIIRRQYMRELSEKTGNDTVLYASFFPCNKVGVTEDMLSIGQGDIQGFMSSLNGLDGNTLDLIIHSPGGSVEATDQLVQYLRAKYSYIRAIIPQNAMSAATMLACACDEIVMGKQSAIGPIDPQMLLRKANGVGYYLPAHSILEDFKKAKKEISDDEKTARVWVPKLLEIPNGFLDLCEKNIKLSEEKVGEWLDAYMFKDETSSKAREIAKWLGNFAEHKTHGRPINYQLAREKGLKVTLLEDDQELQEKVLSVFHSAMLTFEVTQCVKITENQNGKGMYIIANGPIVHNKK